MEKFKKILKTIFESFLWIGVLVIIADFVSKQIVLHSMNVGDTIDIIPGFFYLQYIINKGMAFGFNFNINNANTDAAEITNHVLFILISVLGTALISFIYFKNYKKTNKLTKVSLGLMLAGCIGNMIDRIFYSEAYLSQYASGVDTYGVVDFIAFDFGSYSFPRFNIADASLVIGTIILIIVLIIDEVKESKIKRLKEEENLPEGKIESKDEQLMNGKEESIVEENSEPVIEEKPLEEEK